MVYKIELHIYIWCIILFYLQCSQGMYVTNAVLAIKCLLLVMYMLYMYQSIFPRCKSFLERFEDVHIYFIVARLKIEQLTVRKKVLLAEQTSLLFLLKPFYFPVNLIM